jgi:uncharacterized protein (DUF58 family)
MPEDPAWLDYHIRGRAGAVRPGKHAARDAGQGGDFRAYRPFWQLPDAQRIDVRRSITDPAGDVLVRQMQQRSSLTLIIAADVSRSMAPTPGRSGLHATARLIDAASRSAVRAGDAFGLLAFDNTIRDDLSLPPTRRRMAGQQAAAALRAHTPTGRGTDGLLHLPARLPAGRSLVLLVSDFLLPPATLETALSGLTRHDVVPIVLTAEAAGQLPRLGLVRTADAETGRTRLLLMRPALRGRHQAHAAAHHAALAGLFTRHGLRPFHARGPIDLAALSQHLSAP